MKLEITNRARQYGYIIWKKSEDPLMNDLIGNNHKVQVIIENLDCGMKNIDWKNRRISVGPRRTRSLPETTKYFLLSSTKPGYLEVQFL